MTTRSSEIYVHHHNAEGGSAIDVPAGEAWIIKFIAVHGQGDAVTSQYVFITNSAAQTTIYLYANQSLAAGETDIVELWTVVEEGSAIGWQSIGGGGDIWIAGAILPARKVINATSRDISISVATETGGVNYLPSAESGKKNSSSPNTGSVRRPRGS